MFNPVAQLGFKLSRDLESGTLNLAAVSALAKELELAAFRGRAKRRHDFLAPLELAVNSARLKRHVHAFAGKSFAAFAARWSQPVLGCVFTGHPTFMLSIASYAALARAASDPAAPVNPATALSGDAAHITIDEEHTAALAALARAADANMRVTQAVIAEGRETFPKNWRALRPQPFAFGTWVGYDMDGRTDILWTTSIRFRLKEKAYQLGRYAARTAGILDAMEKNDPVIERLRGIHNRLAAAQKHTEALVSAFTAPLDTPEALSDASNQLSANHPDKLTSLADILKALDGIIASARDDTAAALVGLAAGMQCHRLGAGTVHFRINASQLHNAVRRRLGGDTRLEMGSRTAIVRLREMLAEAAPLPVNFAALAIETTTAVRQFLAMAQILKHVDADSPLRLLIAESEQPVTVLAAVYFAKLFGIDHMVDVSPLFETEAALEHGARILDDLLAEPAYQTYARGRGRIAIQTGFSDAGRFMGQIPAALAIERLQGRLAALMEKHGLADVSALIFNTHGESMGRGAHPSSLRDRLAHALSPWTRAQFARRSIRLAAEVSHQGGDGFVMFGTPELAFAFLTRALEADIDIAAAANETDPFYDEVDISLDFYRAVRDTQVQMFAAPFYGRALTAFGLSLSRATGSRPSRRQSVGATVRADLGRIRAIPHNAILQQLGYPVNVIVGIGPATENDLQRFADLHNRSSRAQSLIRLVRTSLGRASIKTLLAYGELFDGGFWATRTYRGPEEHLEEACIALANLFASDDRAAIFHELATHLRVDGLKLHQLLAALEKPATASSDEMRRTLGVLHALRLALMQHIFLKAAQIPPFSQRNDISRADIMEMIFALRIPEAVELLSAAYPVDRPTLEDFHMQESTAYPDAKVPEYTEIHSRYITPIRQSFDIILGIGVAISHHFGAHG